MKVLYITEYYPYYAAKVVHEVAKRLVKAGCDILVVSSNVDMSNKRRASVAEEIVDSVRVMRFDSFPVEVASTPYMLYNPIKLPGLIKSLKRVIGSYDIIHLHTGHGLLNLTTAAMMTLFNKGTPTIYTSHGIPMGYDSITLEIGSILSKKIVKHLILRNCKFVTTVGKRDLLYWKKQGISAHKIRYIPNGVDTKMFRLSRKIGKQYRDVIGFNEKSIVVLFFAQLRKVKGIDVLMKAIPMVISKNPRVKFLLAGTGPMVSQVESSIRRLNLGDYSKLLLEYISEPDLPKLFNTCDIYVLPSLVEGMPLSLMEAMACGKPVVATNVGDVSVLVQNGINGILIPTNNVESLVNGIIALAKDFELRSTMEEKNLKKLADYDWDHIASEYYKLYLETLGTPAKALK